MALKAKLTADEHKALPEPIREHYKEADGAYVLDADGVVDASKLDEFRENNRTLNRELKELRPLRERLQDYESRYKDIDPDEYHELKKKANPGKGNEGQAEIAAAIEKATKPLNERLQTIESEKAQLARELERTEFERIVKGAAKEAGVDDDVLEDVITRAERRGFRLVDKTKKLVRAMDGDEPVIDDTTHKELTLEAFIKALPASFYGANKGSGQKPPVGNGGARVLVNPDARTFGSNLEAIATGKMNVTLQ